MHLNDTVVFGDTGPQTPEGAYEGTFTRGYVEQCVGIVCGECSYASEGALWSIRGVYTVYSLYSTRKIVEKHPKRLFWPFWPLVTPRAPMVTSAGLSLRVGINIDVLNTSKIIGNRLLAVFD